MKDNLIGAWRLKSWTAYDDKNNKLYPLGINAQGIIIYTDDGSMSATIMNPDQMDHLRDGISMDSIMMGKGAYFSYAGSYCVMDGKALHMVEVSLIPEFIGTGQERFFEIEGNTLTIHSETPLSDGSIVKHILIWQR